MSLTSLNNHMPGQVWRNVLLVLEASVMVLVLLHEVLLTSLPIIWNNLPDFVEVADSFNVFKHRLKCHLFDATF